MKQGKLLIVDDKKIILQALSMFLQFEFEKVQLFIGGSVGKNPAFG